MIYPNNLGNDPDTVENKLADVDEVSGACHISIPNDCDTRIPVNDAHVVPNCVPKYK